VPGATATLRLGPAPTAQGGKPAPSSAVILAPPPLWAMLGGAMAPSSVRVEELADE
jgi:hypothetical protein